MSAARPRFDETHMSKPLHITFDAVPWCDNISIPVCTRTPGGKHVFRDPRAWVRKECLQPSHQLLLIMQQQGRGMANECVLLWSRGSRNQFGKHHYIMLWVAWAVQSVPSDVYKSPPSTPKFGKGNAARQVSWSSSWEPTRVKWFTKNVRKWQQMTFRKGPKAKSAHSHYANHVITRESLYEFNKIHLRAW